MRPGEPACRVPSRLRGGASSGPSSWSSSPRPQSVLRVADRKERYERKKSRSTLAEGERKVREIGAATEVGEAESSRAAIIASLNGWAGRR